MSEQFQFEMRGERMSRVETFVAAAFAFAVSLLVMTGDDIPGTFDELLHATKLIPAFAASFAIMTWIWHSHTVWSRRYGLEDTTTVYLSSSLIFLVLIYVYPLRIVMQSFMAGISDGYFPPAMEFTEYWQIRFMFAFYAFGFLLVCFNFVALYRHALRQRQDLNLQEFEVFDSQSQVYFWIASGAVCLLSLVISLAMPLTYLAFAGYCFFLLFPVLTCLGFVRAKQRKALFA